eukprot:1158831-Pelagomonas_calceolata.AAC.14
MDTSIARIYKSMARADTDAWQSHGNDTARAWTLTHGIARICKYAAQVLRIDVRVIMLAKLHNPGTQPEKATRHMQLNAQEAMRKNI